MMFRNSYRLLLANFGTFWKDFLYKAVVIGLVWLLTLPFVGVITGLSNYSAVVSNLEKLFMQVPFSDIATFFDTLFLFMKSFLSAYSELFVTAGFAASCMTVIYFFVLPFLLSLSDLAVSEVIYGFMASQTKYSYMASFIRKLGKSSVYSVFKTLIDVAFFVPTFLGIYAILAMVESGFLSIIFAPAMFVLFLIIWQGFKITLFSGWAPSIIVFNVNAFKGMGKGMIAIFRRFFKSYSTTGMIILIYTLIASLFGGVSLVLIVPLFIQTKTIYQMVMLFGSQGMRYYVDTDTILAPKKLEETDKIKKVKYII